MGLIRRSLRSLMRSPLRTGGVVVILAVSMGLALTMLTVHGASQNQLESIGTEIGTEIQVRPAGAYGMMGGGEPLDEEDVDTLADIVNVVSVQKTTQTQYSGDSLESPIEAGTLGRRGGPPGGEGQDSTMTMGVMVMGFDPAIEDPVLTGDATFAIVEGRYFTVDEIDADMAVLGEDLAEENGLEIGSVVDMEGVSVEVIGIFDTGQVFGDAMLIMPIDTVQRVFDLEGVTSATVVVDDVDNVESVAEAIREVFDEDTADIVTASDMYGRINESVVNAGETSRIGMIASFVVAAVVILFSVVLMVRQRVREIGVLKAIGASNWRIGLQFSMETLAMTVGSAVIGALIAYPLAQRVANLLVDTSTSATVGGFQRPAGGLFGGGAVTSVAGIDVAVSPEIFLYALGVAVLLAIAASIFPTWYISRVRPAEVLRNE